MKLLKKTACCPRAPRTSATVVDGKLIMTFPDALTPVLWQMDLSDAKASALEVRENKTGGFTLILKTARGDTLDIAPFEARDQAVEGLMAAAAALQSAHGQIRPALQNAAPHNGMLGGVSASNMPGFHAMPRKGRGGVMLTIGVLFMLFLVWMIVSAARAPLLPQNVEMNSAAGPDESGVPMSADEFLQRQ